MRRVESKVSCWVRWGRGGRRGRTKLRRRREAGRKGKVTLIRSIGVDCSYRQETTTQRDSVFLRQEGEICGGASCGWRARGAGREELLV